MGTLNKKWTDAVNTCPFFAPYGASKEMEEVKALATFDHM
jgi:hypothetical protein